MHSNCLDNHILSSIRNKYLDARNRLFLLDYDGTLIPIAKLPESAVLNEKTKAILNNIISDKRNRIAIISGRKKEFIEEQFKDIDAILIAEHGYFIKYQGTDWVITIEIDRSWKKKIIPVLNEYTAKCSGSMVEDKHASIAWHYRNAEEKMAGLLKNELKGELTRILENIAGLYILESDKVLEVKSILYNKGTAASELISKGNYDFILALGDDITDEDLFKVIPGFGFTLKVGCKPTDALFIVKDQSQVIEILKLLTGPPIA